MSEPGPKSPRPREAASGQSTTLVDHSGVVHRTEELADRAIGRLRSEVQLPDVRAEAGRAAAFFGDIHSAFLRFVILFDLMTAGAGVAVALAAGLVDWYMHAAMYGVIVSFVFVYVSSHLKGSRFRRGCYALASVGLKVYFAWILVDLVPARVQMEGFEVIERPAVPTLVVPAAMLVMGASLHALHALFLARFRGRDRSRRIR